MINSSEIQFIWADEIPQCTAEINKYFEGYYSLQLILKNEVSLAFDENNYEVLPGQMWVNYPGPLIQFKAKNKNWHHLYVSFQGKIAENWFRSGLLPNGVLKNEANPCIINLFREIISIVKSDIKNKDHIAKNLLEAILILAQNKLIHTHKSHWLMEVDKKLKKLDMFKPNYKILAKKMGLALSSFRRRFKQETGLSIHQYHITIRMEKSKQLLLHTELTIKEIAYETGYQDIFQFGKQFKQMVGIPPAEFRKKNYLSP